MTKSRATEMQVLTGRPVSPGFAEGVAVLYDGEQLPVPRRSILDEEVACEQKRFRDAVASASATLQQVRERVLAEFGESEAALFQAHLALLNDRYFAAAVEQRIGAQHINAEAAVADEIAAVAGRLDAGADEYFRERNDDIRDIGRRLLRELSQESRPPLSSLPSRAVIIAAELLPSDTLNLDREHVAAIVTERGGATAHAAILARALGVPAVTGVSGAVAKIPRDANVLVDGERGEVTIFPIQEQQVQFLDRQRTYKHDTDVALVAEQEECRTRDGVPVYLYANIRHPSEASDVRRHHLDGVGLFRTEFMFLDAPQPPDMERQVELYQQTANALDRLPLTVRTLDLGGDKIPAFLSPQMESRLGTAMRGLRFSLMVARDLLETQLRALIHVAQRSDLRILLPMVLGREDLGEVMQIIKTLILSGQKVPRVGAMIETPAAIFSLDEILPVADFVSVGTNDLTQYMLAADRIATDVLDVWSVLHPSVLRALRQIVRQCRSAEKPLAICGEAAGEPALACLLVGLGVRQLSMSPRRAARVRLALRQRLLPEVESLAERVLQCDTVAGARELLVAG